MSSKSRKEEVHDNGELYRHHRHNVERRRPAHPPFRCQTPPDVGNMPIWRLIGPMLRRFLFGDHPIQPLSFSANKPQTLQRCTETPSKARLLMASFHSQILHGQLPKQTTSDSMATLLHSTHPPDPFPSTVWPRLHQGVRFPHPSTSSCPAGCTSIFGTSPSPFGFKFFFLY